ncbi:hypothetical protein DVK44_27800 [Streptomyces paludis]|uniref:Uncharacterized protein n=2 Tax=Streptomyces paludis TaxID=2282738 RepID=A0A345I1X8_9ACTN|nr:hypothetical protein DVK44_27800 [Streptomyces paludis]
MGALPDLPARLLALAGEDERLTRAACALPAAAARRRAVALCRADHGRVLRSVVEVSGWPTSSVVGENASIAALQILLHAQDPGLLLSCRPLIAEAVAEKSTPAIHLAYVDDACAVQQGRRQTYGTQIDPRLLRPYPVEDADTVDERRAAVGLPPLDTALNQVLGVMKRPR